MQIIAVSVVMFLVFYISLYYLQKLSGAQIQVYKDDVSRSNDFCVVDICLRINILTFYQLIVLLS